MRLRFDGFLIGALTLSLGVVLVLLPLHAFLSTWGGTAIGPLLVWKSWKELLLVALVPLVVAYLVARSDVFKVLWSRWVNRLILAYVVLHAVWAWLSPANADAIFAGLAFSLRFLAVFVLAQLVVASGAPVVHKLKKIVAPWLLIATIAVSAFAIVQVVFLPADFLAQFGYNKDTTIAPFVLIDDNPDALRAFATMRGPNELGSYLILPLLLALSLVIKERRNVLAGAALGLGVVALALTGSRSAWLGAVVALGTLALLWLPPARLKKWLAWGVVPALIVGAVGLWMAVNVPAVRLAVFHSSPDDPHLLEGSSEKHWEASYNGAVDAINHPLGQGVGTAGPASFYGDATPKIAENYYIQVAQEVGVAGLLLFLAINIALAFRLWRQRNELWSKLLLASFAGLSVINIFLHGWADDPTAMTWWLVAGLYAFAPHGHKSSKIKARA